MLKTDVILKTSQEEAKTSEQVRTVKPEAVKLEKMPEARRKQNT
jgi:hypothetical protein